MKGLITIIIIAVLMIILGSFVIAKVLIRGVQRYERMECLNWLEEKEIYPMWWATDNQIEQCKNYNIEL